MTVNKFDLCVGSSTDIVERFFHTADDMATRRFGRICTTEAVAELAGVLVTAQVEVLDVKLRLTFPERFGVPVEISCPDIEVEEDYDG